LVRLAIDLTVAGHHFHRAADHSTSGLLSTVEVFAAEVTRLRKPVPREAANENGSADRDALGSRPDR
jgi:hypothetical protein